MTERDTVGDSTDPLRTGVCVCVCVAADHDTHTRSMASTAFSANNEIESFGERPRVR